MFNFDVVQSTSCGITTTMAKYYVGDQLYWAVRFTQSIDGLSPSVVRSKTIIDQNEGAFSEPSSRAS